MALTIRLTPEMEKKLSLLNKELNHATSSKTILYLIDTYLDIQGTLNKQIEIREGLEKHRDLLQNKIDDFQNSFEGIMSIGNPQKDF